MSTDKGLVENLTSSMPEGEVFWIVPGGPPPLVRLEYAFRPADRTWTWTLTQPGTPDGLATWILPVDVSAADIRSVATAVCAAARRSLGAGDDHRLDSMPIGREIGRLVDSRADEDEHAYLVRVLEKMKEPFGDWLIGPEVGAQIWPRVRGNSRADEVTLYWSDAATQRWKIRRPTDLEVVADRVAGAIRSAVRPPEGSVLRVWRWSHDVPARIPGDGVASVPEDVPVQAMLTRVIGPSGLAGVISAELRHPPVRPSVRRRVAGGSERLVLVSSRGERSWPFDGGRLDPSAVDELRHAARKELGIGPDRGLLMVPAGMAEPGFSPAVLAISSDRGLVIDPARMAEPGFSAAVSSRRSSAAAVTSSGSSADDNDGLDDGLAMVLVIVVAFGLAYLVGVGAAVGLALAIDGLVLAALLPAPDYTFETRPLVYAIQAGAVILAPLLAWRLDRAMPVWVQGTYGRLLAGGVVVVVWLTGLLSVGRLVARGL